MVDLVLNDNGDLNIQKLTTQVSDQGRIIDAEYDLETVDSNLSLLIRRAIQTPLGEIRQPTLNQDTIDFIDEDYGSAIYRELSEGITLNFLSRVKSHITTALQTAGLLSNISDVQLSVTTYNKIDIFIYFNDFTPNTTVTIDI